MMLWSPINCDKLDPGSQMSTHFSSKQLTKSMTVRSLGEELGESLPIHFFSGTWPFHHSLDCGLNAGPGNRVGL